MKLAKKKLLIIIATTLILVIGLVGLADYNITKNASDKIFDELNKVPTTNTGLLLGTSKQLRSGYRNQYFYYRIDAAEKLLKAGKIRYLIISGDNGNKQYDEPTDMKTELISRGIDSTKLFLDYAGFRTFDSVVRAKEIFSQDSILLISQKFHNERALYIAGKLGITANAYNAEDVSAKYGFKTAVREKFARVKVFLDFIVGTTPKFLGEKISIPSH